METIPNLPCALLTAELQHNLSWLHSFRLPPTVEDDYEQTPVYLPYFCYFCHQECEGEHYHEKTYAATLEQPAEGGDWIVSTCCGENCYTARYWVSSRLDWHYPETCIVEWEPDEPDVDMDFDYDCDTDYDYGLEEDKEYYEC